MDTQFKVFDVIEQAKDGISVRIEFQPRVNAALVSSHYPFIRTITIRNETNDALPELFLTAELLAGEKRVRVEQQVLGPIEPGGEALLDNPQRFAQFKSIFTSGRELISAVLSIDLALAEDSSRQIGPHLSLAIELSAANEFLNLAGMQQYIAAFIQPNTAQITTILRAASDLLKRKTSRDSIEGYQSGEKRAEQIAGALYEALRAFDLTYISPPASFEQTGQKVRTTEQVLADHFGTCIDLSVAYAACLEASGLSAVIFFTRTHAFPGFYRNDVLGASALIRDPNTIANLIESGQIIPLEMTGIGKGTGSMDFHRATQAGAAYVRSLFPDLRAMADIQRARLDRILPLADGSDTLPQTETALAEARSFVSFSALRRISAWKEKDEKVTGRVDQTDDSPPRFKNWKRDLLDLSLRNPLLNMPGSKRVMDFIVPGGMLSRIDDAVHAGYRIKLVGGLNTEGLEEVFGKRAVAEIPAETVKTVFETRRELYSTLEQTKHIYQLRQMKRTAQTLEQETGSNYLFLTIGALIHPKERGGECRAPLLLIPVKLSGVGGLLQFQITADGGELAQPNLCLLAWLRITKGVSLDALANPAIDDSGIAIKTVFSEIRSKLLEANLPYRVDESCSLAILRFSTFQIWRDLDVNWRALMQNPVVEHLVTRPGETFVQDRRESTNAAAPNEEIDDEALRLPIAADGSQLKAIKQAVRGRSFVLEGPPGTGKSQTIANLIAHGMHQGKSILFVAAKEVALDVVKHRLDEIGIGRFALALYGTDVSMNDIRTQLKRSLEAAVYVDKGVYAAADARYRAAFRTLRDYPPRVHRKNGWGYSYWSAYDLLRNLGDGPSWTPDSGVVGTADLNRMESLIADFSGRVAGLGLAPADPWILCGGAQAAAQNTDVQSGAQRTASAENLKDALSELSASFAVLSHVNSEWKDILNSLSPGVRIHRFLDLMDAGAAGLLPGDAHLPYIDRPSWRDAVSDARAHIVALRDRHAAYLQLVSPELARKQELEIWIQRVDLLDSKRFFVERRKKPIREAAAAYAAQGTNLSGTALSKLLHESAAVRDRSAEISDAVSRISGLLMPQNWCPDLPNALEQFDRAVLVSRAAVWLHGYAPEVWACVNTRSKDVQTMELLRDISGSWDAWLGLLGARTRSVDQWLAGRPWLRAWEHDAAIWAQDITQTGDLQLQRYTECRHYLNELERLGAGDLADKLARAAFPLADADVVFLRGVAEASFAERRAAGSLAEFDAGAQIGIAETYNAAAEQLRSLAVSAGPERILNARPFRADRVIGEVASLVRQIERKRGGMSFREITKSYPQALLSLCPCFMMSPGSVAHFLDADAMCFDLVIFDEASQIRVPQAIGAMGRGRSVVVVGDSKQMPPTRIMEVDTTAESPGEAEDGAEVVDLESILSEAVESGLPQMWLSWHYRSKNEHLIAFSNSVYYENRLVTLPEPGTSDDTGILWHRVDGQFARGKERTNAAEAEAILAEIKRRLADPGTARDSLGVVCFNMQQRDHILDLLENSTDPLIQTALSDEPGKQLFVKNLENVQGDERDVILFSLAFSKDPETGILPLNFGPLNNEGGERRLNVAITRARKQVLLFSSFDPSDIDLARSSAKGIHDLKRYLEFAAALSRESPDPSVTKPENPFTENQNYFARELAEELRARGYLVTANLGLSAFKLDLAVKKQGETHWRTAIVLDNPVWGVRTAVADRDGVSELLKQLKAWKSVARIWLPGWIRDREGEMKRLIAVIESADTALGTGGSVAMVETAGESTAQEAVLAGSAAGETNEKLPRFRGASTEQTHAKNVLNNLRNSYAIVCGIGQEVLRAEGPTALPRLISVIYKRCGYTRIGAEKQRELAAIIRREFSIDPDDFVWPAGMNPLSWHGVRYAESRADRVISEISKEEIQSAMELVLRESLSAERGELIMETARRLGYERPGAESKAWMEKALTYGLAAGRFSERDGRLLIAGYRER